MNISKDLLHWYKYNKRNFPWRDTKDSYAIWLSEIILQQTKTAQGLPYFNAFIKKYKDVLELAKADEQDVLHLWQGLGYYSRARNLHFAAKQVANEFNGVFPSNYKELITLKGVGDYTASAISSISIDEPNAVVDGNVYRVLARIFGIETPINSAKAIKEFKVLAQNLLPKKNIGDYNQAIMDFGAMVCTPKKSNCDSCIFNDKCFAYINDSVYDFPVKIKKGPIRKRYFNYLVFIDANLNTQLIKRTEKDIWLNLFEFPLIETETEINEAQLIGTSKFSNIVNQDYQISLFNENSIKHILSHQHIYCKFWILQVDEINDNKVLIKNKNKFPVSTLISNFYKKFITFDI